MSASPPVETLPDWSPIQETVCEFRSDFTNLERLVDGLFDEVERLSKELEQKANELVAERERLADREQQLAEQREEAAQAASHFEHQEAQLAELLTELRDAKQHIGAQIEEMTQGAVPPESLKELVEAGNASANNQLQEKLSDLEERRDSLEKELEAARVGNAELTEAMSQQNSEIQEKASALEVERNDLRRELDAIRGRNAELTEMLSSQKSELAEQQAGTAAELKRLGSLVEERFQRFVQLPPEQPAAEAPAAKEAKEAPSDGSGQRDPVVSSVVAQLAKLQKTVSRRGGGDE